MIEEKNQKRKRFQRKMEDVVPETESLLHPANLGSKEEAEVQQKEDEATGKEKKAKGFLNHLISNLVAGENPGKDRKIEEDDEKQRETEAEEKGGGLLDHIIRNLVSPKAGDVNRKKVEVSESSNGRRRTENESFGSEEELGVNREGLIKNVISNFFHPSDQAEVANNIEKVDEETIVKPTVEENEEVKAEGGGGLIDNIVSHLPTSLRDDVAPTTEEAAILIHSIVHG